MEEIGAFDLRESEGGSLKPGGLCNTPGSRLMNERETGGMENE